MTISSKSKSSVNVGVDVGKEMFDVCIHEKDIYWRETNTPEGVAKVLRRLSHYKVERLVMEATGRYQLLLAEQAFLKDLAVCIVKPLSVRRYAGAIERLARHIHVLRCESFAQIPSAGFYRGSFPIPTSMLDG